MQYTDEQQGVIESPAQTLAVNAFAGTGKTTLLEGVAASRSDERMLYLAFNKGVADEARDRFPPHVMCRTSHSLAFKQFGVPYRHKLRQPKPYHLKELVYRRAKTYDRRMLLADLGVRTVLNWLNSAEEVIGPEHISLRLREQTGADECEALELANLAWEAMRNPNNSQVPMPHDGYLKLFQLSRPKLGQWFGTVLLDEAQDTNPCLLAIFHDQTDVRRILVGDEHQNIYGFRGALNAMTLVAGERHALTASWRFGEPVAEVANTLLQVFKGERLALRGLGGPSSVGARNRELQSAYLHRTNAGLFDRAVQLLDEDGQRLHFLKGPEHYNFETIEDVWNLKRKRKHELRDPFMRTFSSYGDFLHYVDLVDDRELKARLSVVDAYGAKIPALIDALNDAHVGDVEQATAVLTTAHKAKGMQWEQVILGEDFPETVGDNAKPLTTPHIRRGSKAEPLPEEEANLLYVAATRAQRNLVLNEDLQRLMAWAERHAAMPAALAA